MMGRVLAAGLVLAAAAAASGDGPRVDVVFQDPNDVRMLAVAGSMLVGWNGAVHDWALHRDALREAVTTGESIPVHRLGTRMLARLERPGALPPAELPARIGGYPVAAGAVYRGRRYLATFAGGLWRGDGERIEGSPPEIRDLVVFDDRLVLAHGEGIDLLDGDRIERVRLAALPANDVSALAWDGEGLWVGFFDQGLARLEAGRSRWRAIPVEGGPKRSWINALAWDGESLWVASDGGLGVYDAAGGAVVPVEGFDGKVEDVRVAGDGKIVTEPRAVHVGDGDRWERIDRPWDSMHTALVAAGGLWVGGQSGVVRRAEGGWRRWSLLEGSLPDSWVTALLPVGDAMWVGTYDAGLVVLPVDREGGARAVAPDAWVNVRALAEAHGWVAAGLMADGLLLVERRTGRRVRLGRSQGLPGEDVTAFAPGRPGALWVATRSGIACVILERSERGGSPCRLP